MDMAMQNLRFAEAFLKLLDHKTDRFCFRTFDDKNQKRRKRPACPTLSLLS